MDALDEMYNRVAAATAAGHDDLIRRLRDAASSMLGVGFPEGRDVSEQEADRLRVLLVEAADSLSYVLAFGRA